MQVGKDQRINFTVSNDGTEGLISVVVSDELIDGKGQIEDLVCTFPDGSTGTEWDGVFEVGTQFDCTGTIPALLAGDTHTDRATVTAIGVHSGTSVDDEDDWSGYADPAAPTSIDKDKTLDKLAKTGSSPLFWLGAGALLLLAAGATLLIIKRRQHTSVDESVIE